MKLFARIVAAVLACGAVISAQALVIGVTEGVTYRATDNEIEARFDAIAKVLGTATRQPVKVQVISSYNGLRDALKKGQLDLAFIHPSHIAFEAIKGNGFKAVAWTSGYTEYKVSLLCKEPQPIQDWAMVSGKAFVTPDPDSITAVMTRAMLAEHRLKPTDVKLQTTRYQDAVPFYVENGFAAYGATASGSVIKAWKDKGGKTCAESRPMPIKQWIASPRLDPSVANVLRDALLGLDQTEPGRRALAASGYKGFVAPSDEQEKKLILWLGL
jgi:ABC-type phosphate/phosphonate transport system substrate-binding protein